MSQVSPEPPQRSNLLRREVGIFGATMMGLGAIVGTESSLASAMRLALLVLGGRRDLR